MAEKDKIEIQRLTLQLTNAAQDIQLRQSFSRQILGYLWAFSVFCAAILLMEGFNIKGFSLPSSVLVTLVGGTAASAFGLVSVVLVVLFRSPITTTKDRKSQRP
jgi:ABC-type polysaccharide/polyol phosphate export permease